jgi:hypothetical protein
MSPIGKVGAGGGVLTALLGAGYLLGKGLWIFVVILVLLLLILLGGYLLLVWWRRKRLSARMSGELQQHSAASPRGVSDPGQRARLDDLRKKFEEGVQAYRSRGKDIYSLPWYLIVGEPGSGKTEAVRHSNVGFPPGMQDEFQGVGGTINMNWWFTNQAVLLDTAGRLMFEEVKPGETSEWKEFLGLLNKYRPNCPINGLLLVIPTESLIKDTMDDIQRKAGKIAQQLDVIQRLLDVRFPVFVVVSKCDKILGFRESFDGLTDPQLQHQMMGWANPDPLDSQFRPDQVGQHVENVIQRLRRRRLALLRDPVPESDTLNARRTDEVDTLYALPHSLGAIVPRLRRYLETIFTAGEWSSKPLFLRGIYFSSSMREGAALDQELAEAIGVPVDEVTDFKVWERERSYFLRDLFLEKVFKERGLVTRATNTGAMLRRRKVLLYSFGFAALAAFGILAWFSTQSLKQSIVTQSQAWQEVVRQGWWDDQTWKKSLIQRQNNLSYTYETNTTLIDGRFSLAEFQNRLRDAATNELRAGLLQRFFAPGLAADYNSKSRTDQRIAFETAVVKPLVEAARQKIKDPQNLETGEGLRRQANVMGTLIGLEAGILTRGTGTNTGTLDEEAARTFADPLLSYVAGPGVTLDPKLASVWAWTYSHNEAARGSWPAKWLSDTNAIFAGLANLVRGVTNGVMAQATRWNQVQELQQLLRTMETREGALLAAVKSGETAGITNVYQELQAARQKLDSWLADRNQTESPLFKDGWSLTNASDIFQRTVAAGGVGALEAVRNANRLALVQTKDYEFFKEIQRRLLQVQTNLVTQVAQFASPTLLDEFRRLDGEMLAKAWDKLAYAFRCDNYQVAIGLLQKSGPSGPWKPGLKGRPLQEFLAEELGPVQKAETVYEGGFKEGFLTISSGLRLRVTQTTANDYFEQYLQNAKRYLRTKVAFPLAPDVTNTMAFSEFDDLNTTLKFLGDDGGAPVFQSYGVTNRPGWEPFFKTVSDLNRLTAALGGDAPQRITVSLLPLDDACRTQDAWRDTLRRVQLKGGTRVPSNDPDKPLGTIGLDQEIALEMTDQSEPPVKKAHQATGPWGPVWLVLKMNSRQDPANPRAWLVDWPVADSNFKGDIRLKLQFEKPLPDVKAWPTLNL